MGLGEGEDRSEGCTQMSISSFLESQERPSGETEDLEEKACLDFSLLLWIKISGEVRGLRRRAEAVFAEVTFAPHIHVGL